MKKNICVYTCITGDYDNIPKIEKKEAGIDYLCFTNNKKLKSNDWQIIQIEDSSLDNQRLSRKIKILGHDIIDKNYDISLWMDATVVFKKSIKEFIKKYYDENKASFSSFKHSSRNCIYEEAKACVKYRKDTKENIKEHILFLEKEGYPRNNGLYEMTVFIKNHNDKKVRETMNLWFKMVCNHSKRDQLSFMYCVFKTGMKINTINLNVWNNEWFICNNHNVSKDINFYRVYFDDGNEYNIDFDFQGKFDVKEGKYNINLIVPCNTNKTIVELSKVPFLKLDNLKINDIKNIGIFYFNNIHYKNSVVFYNENGGFEIYNSLKKNDKLNISMNLEILDNFYLSQLLRDINLKNNKLEIENKDLLKENNDYKVENGQLQREIVNLNNEIQKILNSKSWKLIRKFDKIRGK